MALEVVPGEIDLAPAQVPWGEVSLFAKAGGDPSHVDKGIVYRHRGGNSVGSVGLALRGRGPCTSGGKLSGMNASGGWICIGAGSWGGRRRFVIMLSSANHGLRDVGAVIAGISPFILFHFSLRCLIATEVSDPESK